MNHQSIIFQLQGDRAVLESDHASTSCQVDNTYFMIFTTILTFYALTADDLRTTFSKNPKRMAGSRGEQKAVKMIDLGVRETFEMAFRLKEPGHSSGHNTKATVKKHPTSQAPCGSKMVNEY